MFAGGMLELGALGANNVERLRGSLPVPTRAFAFMAK